MHSLAIANGRPIFHQLAMEEANGKSVADIIEEAQACMKWTEEDVELRGVANGVQSL